MVFYKYIGYGVTDENGVAKLDHDAEGNPLTHSYTGTGAGEVDVVASLDNPVLEGSIVSEIYEIKDCIIADKGTSSDHNDFWTVSNGSLNRLNTETELVIESGKTYVMPYFNLTNTDSFVIEFDTIFDCVKGSANPEIQFRNSSWSQVKGLYLSDYTKDTWTHIKLQVKNGQLTIWIGDTQLSPTSIANIAMFNFYRVTDDNYLKFKNFAYYPI